MDAVCWVALESTDFRYKSTKNHPKALILQGFYGSGARGRGFKSHHFDQTVRAFVLTVNFIFAGVAELADAPDLGSGVYDVGVRGLSPAPAGKPRSKLGTMF